MKYRVDIANNALRLAMPAANYIQNGEYYTSDRERKRTENERTRTDDSRKRTNGSKEDDTP